MEDSKNKLLYYIDDSWYERVKNETAKEWMRHAEMLYSGLQNTLDKQSDRAYFFLTYATTLLSGYIAYLAYSYKEMSLYLIIGVLVTIAFAIVGGAFILIMTSHFKAKYIGSEPRYMVREEILKEETQDNQLHSLYLTELQSLQDTIDKTLLIIERRKKLMSRGIFFIVVSPIASGLGLLAGIIWAS